MTYPAWQAAQSPVGECPCRWNLYCASCPKPWHQQLAARSDGFTALTGSPEFPAQDWQVAS